MYRYIAFQIYEGIINVQEIKKNRRFTYTDFTETRLGELFEEAKKLGVDLFLLNIVLKRSIYSRVINQHNLMRIK